MNILYVFLFMPVLIFGTFNWPDKVAVETYLDEQPENIVTLSLIELENIESEYLKNQILSESPMPVILYGINSTTLHTLLLLAQHPHTNFKLNDAKIVASAANFLEINNIDIIDRILNQIPRIEIEEFSKTSSLYKTMKQAVERRLKLKFPSRKNVPIDITRH